MGKKIMSIKYCQKDKRQSDDFVIQLQLDNNIAANNNNNDDDR